MFTSIQCTKPEQERAREQTGEAVNNAFDATSDALRNVAESVNDAVYK